MTSHSNGINELFFSGAIFTEDQKNSSVELAFKYAVYRINKDKTLLPKTSLVYDIQYVPRDDSFHASKKGKKRDTSLSNHLLAEFHSWCPFELKSGAERHLSLQQAKTFHINLIHSNLG